jgi:hypothetical protein
MLGSLMAQVLADLGQEGKMKMRNAISNQTAPIQSTLEDQKMCVSKAVSDVVVFPETAI